MKVMQKLNIIEMGSSPSGDHHFIPGSIKKIEAYQKMLLKLIKITLIFKNKLKYFVSAINYINSKKV